MTKPLHTYQDGCNNPFKNQKEAVVGKDAKKLKICTLLVGM
jgi:hypothetical protein